MIFFELILAGLLISENSMKVTINGGAMKYKLFVKTGNNATNNMHAKVFRYFDKKLFIL